MSPHSSYQKVASTPSQANVLAIKRYHVNGFPCAFLWWDWTLYSPVKPKKSLQSQRLFSWKWNRDPLLHWLLHWSVESTRWRHGFRLRTIQGERRQMGRSFMREQLWDASIPRSLWQASKHCAVVSIAFCVVQEWWTVFRIKFGMASWKT